MIRNKLILAYLVPTAVLLVLAGVTIYVQARASLEEELGQRLVAVAESTVGALPSGEPRRLAKLTADDQATLKRLRVKLESVRRATGVRRVFIVDRSLKSLVDTREDVAFGDNLFELQADRVEMEQVLSPPFESVSSILFTGSDGVRYKNGYAPLVYEGQIIGALCVEGSAAFFEIMGDFRNLMAITGLLSLLVIVLVSALVARFINGPIEVLEAAARRLGQGDLSTEVEIETGDEFETLAGAFNEMRQDLLDRDRQMQMMLSGIAHEVRNPLGGMELFCGLLAEDVAEMQDDHPQLLEYTDKITRELGYLARVVNDFLDYARQRSLIVSRFEARELLGEVVQVMSRDMAAWGVEVGIGALEDGIEVTADKDALHRVLLNLARNAGQASSPGTRVEIECRAIEKPGERAVASVVDYESQIYMGPESPAAGPWRAILIRDEGKGIAEGGLASIFEAFYTTKEKGSGLGLALTTKVIEEHGGAMAVASTQGVGTLMVVMLPFKEDIEPARMEIPDGWLG